MATDDTPPARQAGTGIDWLEALDQHRRWLRTVALARVGDSGAADEVLQDVAASAIEHGHRLRDPAKAAPWLYRLVVVAALQYRRRCGRRRKLVNRYAERLQPAELDSREYDPLDWLLVDEQRALVRRALGELPRRDAEMLMLKYTENWTYRQLAAYLGLTTSAVEARLHQARKKMRQVLAVLDRSLLPRGSVNR